MVANHSRKEDARTARGPGRNHRQAVEAVRRTPAPDGRTVVKPGNRIPRDAMGFADVPIQRGDVLRVTCAAGTARVVEVLSHQDLVIVEWPWTSPAGEDPYTVALRIPEGGRAKFGLFEFSPPPTRDTRAGDVFTVTVPPSVVHVSYVGGGWDRSHGTPSVEQLDANVVVAVLPYGMSETPDTTGERAEKRIELGLWSVEPWTAELLCRPYEWLPDRAEVIDAEGTSWEYLGPLDWVTTRTTPRTEGPVWPLTLVNVFDFEPKPEEVAAVAAGSATGSHAAELERWRTASGADLVPFEEGPVWLGLSAEELDAIGRRVRRYVAGLNREQVAGERESARRALRMMSKVVDTEEDWKGVQAAQWRLDTLDEVLAELEESGATVAHAADEPDMTAAYAVVRDAVKKAFPGPAPACCGHVTCNGDGPCGYIVVGLITDSVRCDCHGDGPSDGVRAWLTP